MQHKSRREAGASPKLSKRLGLRTQGTSIGPLYAGGPNQQVWRRRLHSAAFASPWSAPLPTLRSLSHRPPPPAARPHSRSLHAAPCRHSLTPSFSPLRSVSPPARLLAQWPSRKQAPRRHLTREEITGLCPPPAVGRHPALQRLQAAHAQLPAHLSAGRAGPRTSPGHRGSAASPRPQVGWGRGVVDLRGSRLRRGCGPRIQTCP